ncbi:MAG: hypothetical protein CYPHOPRED_000208 [Cyphobasidiales sp. Tagirdzhanova-0007]|nr:MAG: hypothetical protein CYPHOPRED_000208 [Cyphobasidiales sp. Tagirdzhanova-0007]
MDIEYSMGLFHHEHQEHLQQSYQQGPYYNGQQQGPYYQGQPQAYQQPVAPVQQQQQQPAPQAPPQEHHVSNFLKGPTGARLVQAAEWGFGATLGADAANAVFGDLKKDL